MNKVRDKGERAGGKEGKRNVREEHFHKRLEELAASPLAQRMRKYIQHGRITTFDHCVEVAKLSHRIASFLPGKTDFRDLAESAFLHDYYLYDWHTSGDKLHGYHHPDIAAENAVRDFDISPRAADSIRTHMWPLTISKLPSSREAAIVCAADKLCSLKETLFCRRNLKAGKKLVKKPRR